MEATEAKCHAAAETRRLYANSDEFETEAEHGRWCEGCSECWPEEEF